MIGCSRIFQSVEEKDSILAGLGPTRRGDSSAGFAVQWKIAEKKENYFYNLLDKELVNAENHN
jgi:hypothetical protein